MTDLALALEDSSALEQAEIEAATVAARGLASLNPTEKTIVVSAQEDAAAQVRLPASVVRALMKVVTEMANGNAIAIVPVEAELTTQQAADLLNVSRPHFVSLLETGKIEFRMVGTHRKVKGRDVLAYRDRETMRRREALAEMARLDSELGLDEDDATVSAN